MTVDKAGFAVIGAGNGDMRSPLTCRGWAFRSPSSMFQKESRS